MTSLSRRSLLTAVPAAAVVAAVPANAEATTALDLAPRFTVSSAQAAGFAGTVALRIDNVGAQRHYGEFPTVAFRVEVHTAGGPVGVDRPISFTRFNGAHVRDLGFDTERSVRRFEVHLSNPILAGESQLVASFQLGDGLTREGRLTNTLVATQTARLNGDSSTGNDQGISSTTATTDDFGRPHRGVF